MYRLKFVCFSALVGLGAAVLVQADENRPPGDRPPNVVIIFMDDMGYADIGPFGAKDYPPPNLDRMAREGRRFTDFHAATAVCSASRAALLTGCYPERVGILGALFPDARHGLNSKEFTLAELGRQHARFWRSAAHPGQPCDQSCGDGRRPGATDHAVDRAVGRFY